jgi:hypothetical protein
MIWVMRVCPHAGSPDVQAANAAACALSVPKNDDPLWTSESLADIL